MKVFIIYDNCTEKVISVFLDRDKCIKVVERFNYNDPDKEKYIYDGYRRYEYDEFEVKE